MGCSCICRKGNGGGPLEMANCPFPKIALHLNHRPHFSVWNESWFGFSSNFASHVGFTVGLHFQNIRSVVDLHYNNFKIGWTLNTIKKVNALDFKSFNILNLNVLTLIFLFFIFQFESKEKYVNGTNILREYFLYNWKLVEIFV